MTHVPNILTAGRIFSAVLMLIFYKNGWAVIGLCSAAAASDACDGWIARRTGHETRLGARLDSTADAALYGVLAVLAVYWLGGALVSFIPWIVFIALLRMVNFLIVVCKYHVFAGLHTWANKISGALVFLAPLLYLLFKSTFIFWPVCIITLFSAVEELLIHVTSPALDENRRSLLFTSRRSRQ